MNITIRVIMKNRRSNQTPSTKEIANSNDNITIAFPPHNRNITEQNSALPILIRAETGMVMSLPFAVTSFAGFLIVFLVYLLDFLSIARSLLIVESVDIDIFLLSIF